MKTFLVLLTTNIINLISQLIMPVFFVWEQSSHEYTLEKYNEIITVNLSGTFLCMQEEIKMMLQSNGGSIVNILSNTSIGANTYGSAPYIVSKHGEAGLTKVAALEYAQNGIRVNGVLPGLTDTEMLRQNSNDQMVSTYGCEISNEKVS